MSNNEAETGGVPPSEGMDLDTEEVASKDNPAGAGTSVPLKAKKNTEVKRQVKRGGNTNKKRKVVEEGNEDTNEEDDSPTTLRQKLQFYKEKADMTEDRLIERSKELKDERAKNNAEQKKRKEEIKKLEEDIKKVKGQKKGKKREKTETETSDDSSEPDSSSEDSEPRIPAKKFKRIPKIEVTAADRRAARVCAYDPCDRLPDCTFVHVSKGKNFGSNNISNDEISYSGIDESEVCQEPVKEGKERRARSRPRETGRQGTAGEDQGKNQMKSGCCDRNSQMEDFLLFENKNYNLDPCFNSCEANIGSPCFNSYDPSERERNSDVDDSDMYFKIKMMKEDMDQSIKIHKLRKECKDPCSNSREVDGGFPCFNSYDPNAREMNSDMYYKIKMMKEDMDQSIKIHKLRKECKGLTKSSEQKKFSSPKKKAHVSKGADQRDQAVREHSGQTLGNRERSKVKKSKIKHIDKKAKRNRVNKKKDTDTIKIQDENLNIVSINARGFASKRKSIEEILKNENVDIAIVSELSGKNISTFTGYKPFIKSGGHMHGLAIFVRNSIAKRTLRIHDESDLEIVHLRLSSTVPALNIIGTYLQVESRQTVDNINRVWNLYTEKVQHVLDRGEALLCIGDFNRPLQTKRLSHGTKLLNEWLDSKNMILVNDKTVNTRTDPARGSGSVLDLALISANIEQGVMNFEVDTQQKMTAFKMVKRRDKTVEKVFTDHFTIKLELKIPMKMFRKGKKKSK